MINVFLTGGSGFVGRNVIERFLSSFDFHLICLIKDDDAIGFNILKEYGVEIIKEHEFETFNGRIDLCIHLASYGVKYGDRDIDIMIDVNVKLAVNTMRFVALHGCKYFFNTGSCFEYGTNALKEPIKEDDILNPEDLYAASKVACEDILKVYSKLLNIKLITLRLFSIFGKYENSSRLFPLIIKAGITKTPLELTGGEQVRDYMDVKTVANIIFELSQKKEVIDFDVVNVSTGEGITIKEFINLTVSACGFDKDLFLFDKKEYRNNESMFFVGNNSRLKKIINIDLSLKTKSIIDAYKYFKEDCFFKN